MEISLIDEEAKIEIIKGNKALCYKVKNNGKNMNKVPVYIQWLKLMKGEKEAFDLINREEKKFEPKIMVAGGISSVGITDLIISEGTLNEFAYAQALLFYKDSYEKIKNQGKIDLYFEQDGASSHISLSNKKLIEDLFGKKN